MFPKCEDDWSKHNLVHMKPVWDVNCRHKKWGGPSYSGFHVTQTMHLPFVLCTFSSAMSYLLSCKCWRTHEMSTGLPMELFMMVNGWMERKMGRVFSHILMVQSITVQDICFSSVLSRNKCICISQQNTTYIFRLCTNCEILKVLRHVWENCVQEAHLSKRNYECKTVSFENHVKLII